MLFLNEMLYPTALFLIIAALLFKMPVCLPDFTKILIVASGTAVQLGRVITIVGRKFPLHKIAALKFVFIIIKQNFKRHAPPKERTFFED